MKLLSTYRRAIQSATHTKMNEINLTDRLTATHIAAKAFDDGDHWQDGKAFLPFVSLDSANQALQRAQMEASLETENVIAEVLDNEQNAVFGREPDWQFVPEDEENDAEMNLADEAEQPAVDYWNDFNLLSVLKEVNRLAATQQRAVIRAYVPKGLLTANNRKRDLREAMNLIRFEVLSADKAGVFLDEETHQNFGLLKKQTKDGKNHTELTYTENSKTFVKIVEQTDYATLASETLATLKQYMPSDKTTTDATSYDLGGELLYFEIGRKPLITESVISNQKDVNLCLTMKNRLTYQAAYRDFFFFNSEQPVDKDGNPAPLKTGGKAANFTNGVAVYKTGADGKPTGEIIGYANPSMTVIDPANPESIIKSKEASAFAIYNQTSQVHLTKIDAASASGISKRESRFSFEKKCLEIKQIMDAAGRWMLKVLTLFAADNLGQSAKYSTLRFDFNCRIDAGAPDAEEIAQAAQDVKDGNLSEETYLSKYLRFDDADSEKMRLVESESYKIAMWQKRLETAQLATDLGLPSSEWIQIIYPDDEVKQKEVLPLIEVKPKVEKPIDLGVGV